MHIDFGFILTISPGGNLGFETASFKMSHEMTQLLDPRGDRRSPSYLRFCHLAAQGYLVARQHRASILALFAAMSASGLPCFGHGRPLEGLAARLQPDLSDRQAAQARTRAPNAAPPFPPRCFYFFLFREGTSSVAC